MAKLEKLDKSATGEIKLEGFEESPVAIGHIERKQLRSYIFEYSRLVSKGDNESEEEQVAKSLALFDLSEAIITDGFKHVVNQPDFTAEELLDVLDEMQVIKLAGHIVEFNKLDQESKKNYSVLVDSFNKEPSGDEAKKTESEKETTSITVLPAVTSGTG